MTKINSGQFKKGIKGDKTLTWKGGIPSCNKCGTLFSYYNKTGKCIDCKKKEIRESVFCPCGVIFEKTLSRKKVFCSKECPFYISNLANYRTGKIGLSGKDSPHWKEDRTKLIKSEKKHLDGRYREWMFSVKKRDNWSCRISDINCKGRLESHHILNWKEYPELRYEINNGITLCHAHHPRGRENEAKLSPFLINLVVEGKNFGK